MPSPFSHSPSPDEQPFALPIGPETQLSTAHIFGNPVATPLHAAIRLVRDFSTVGAEAGVLLMRYIPSAAVDLMPPLYTNLKLLGDDWSPHFENLVLAAGINRQLREMPCHGEVDRDLMEWIKGQNADRRMVASVALDGVSRPSLVDLYRRLLSGQSPRPIWSAASAVDSLAMLSALVCSGPPNVRCEAAKAVAHAVDKGLFDDPSLKNDSATLLREGLGHTMADIIPAYFKQMILHGMRDRAAHGGVFDEFDDPHYGAERREDRALHLLKDYGMAALPAACALVASEHHALAAEQVEQLQARLGDSALPLETRAFYAFRLRGMVSPAWILPQLSAANADDRLLAVSMLWDLKDPATAAILHGMCRSEDPATAASAALAWGSSIQDGHRSAASNLIEMKIANRDAVLKAMMFGAAVNNSPEELFVYRQQIGPLPWEAKDSHLNTSPSAFRRPVRDNVARAELNAEFFLRRSELEDSAARSVQLFRRYAVPLTALCCFGCMFLADTSALVGGAATLGIAVLAMRKQFLSQKQWHRFLKDGLRPWLVDDDAAKA